MSSRVTTMILAFGAMMALLPGKVCADTPLLADSTFSSEEKLSRQEVLAMKTNLLFYGAYIPGYDRWCPIPNVALEFFPKKGHFTFGASFDMPWWQDYQAHKYFQVRHYQVEARY